MLQRPRSAARACSARAVAAARRALPAHRGVNLRSATPVAKRRSLYHPHNVVSVPALSPTMETGTIARWHVAEGDAFGAGDSIAEVETDKASMEWEMQDDGVVAKHLVAPGTEVAVGTPAVVLVEDAADVGAFADFEAPAGAVAAPAPAAAPEPAPAPVAPAVAAPVVPVAAPAPAAPSGGRVAASPLARKEAQAKGVDLSSIVGTGPGGRVTFDDVHNAPAQAGVAQAHASDYAITPEAAYLAAKLAHSAQTAPHYYLTMDIQVGKALALLDELNAGESEKIGLGDLFVKAAANAAVAVPDVNASWLDGVVRQYQRVDVNLVVGVGEGLRAPVLIDVANMSLKGRRCWHLRCHDRRNAVFSRYDDGPESRGVRAELGGARRAHAPGLLPGARGRRRCRGARRREGRVAAEARGDARGGPSRRRRRGRGGLARGAAGAGRGAGRMPPHPIARAYHGCLVVPCDHLASLGAREGVGALSSRQRAGQESVHVLPQAPQRVWHLSDALTRGRARTLPIIRPV